MFSDMATPNKIKATIIPGFMGTGKTTFTNIFLLKYYDKHIALLENEFGEVSIDTKLTKGIDAG